MSLRINNIVGISSKEILSDITAYLREDILQRETSLINEILEKTYTLNGVNILKVVYKKYTLEKTYRRESLVFGFTDSGNVFPEPLDSRYKEYFSSEVRDYKATLVNKILTFFSNRIDKINDVNTTAIFDSVMGEALILEAIANAQKFGDISKIIEAINTVSNTYLDMEMFNWTDYDSNKIGIDYIPTLREWVLLYFNEENFTIYPTN